MRRMGVNGEELTRMRTLGVDPQLTRVRRRRRWGGVRVVFELNEGDREVVVVAQK